MRQQIEPVANGEIRIVVEGKKPDRHNLILTKYQKYLFFIFIFYYFYGKQTYRIQTIICLKDVKHIIACVAGVKRRGKGGEEPFLPSQDLKPFLTILIALVKHF